MVFIFFKSPILKSEPNHTVCLLTFFLCGKNFPSLINIFKCTFLFTLCLESRCYEHLILHSRCVSETFILKPFLGPWILLECTGSLPVKGLSAAVWEVWGITTSLVPTNFQKLDSSKTSRALFLTNGNKCSFLTNGNKCSFLPDIISLF